MKKFFTPFSKLVCFLLFLSFSTNLLAQPANDRCENATPIVLAADAASIQFVDGDTRMAEDATMVPAPDVCSGSWFIDDVWFTFSTGATVPEFGIVIQTEAGTVSTDVVNHGMAAYSDCAVGSDPIDCFSNAPGRRTMEIPPACLAPNTDYRVRIWSAGNTMADEGTFRVGAYEAEGPFFSSTDVVIWEDDFESGLGDWTTTSNADTSEVWRWYPAGEAIPNAFGGVEDLTTARSACTAKVGFPGGWYQTGMTGNSDSIPPTYTDYVGELISPTLDLSATTAPVSVKFDQVSRKLNPNSANPHMYVSFSYDDGVTWADTTEINFQIAANDPARQTTDKVKLGDAAIGNSTVRVRFTYDMDFYYWIVDNVQIVETEANNMQANQNWYAVAHNALTPRSQVSPIGFMIDVENIGAQEQTGVNLNMSITNSVGATVFTDDLDYGSIPGGALVENQIMTNTFLPDNIADTYVATYTVSANEDDFDSSNNTQSFRFDVTEATFAREFNENIVGITPGDAAIINWSYGAYYYVPNGLGYECEDILFTITNADQVVDGNVNVTLYRWEDQNGNNLAEANERGVSTATPPITGAIIGNGTHTIAAGETDIVVQLENWDDDQLPVFLEDDAHYIVVCAFTSPAGSDTQIAIGSTSGDDNNTDYAPMNFVQTEFGNPFWNNFFGAEATFDTELSGGFAWAPRIRMNIAELEVSTEEPLSEDNKINVFPNPASEMINLKLELTETFEEGIVKITDATGKVMNIQSYDNIQNELFTYDVSQYAAGTYFVQFVSEAGNRTTRFTVVK